MGYDQLPWHYVILAFMCDTLLYQPVECWWNSYRYLSKRLVRASSVQLTALLLQLTDKYLNICCGFLFVFLFAFLPPTSSLLFPVSKEIWPIVQLLSVGRKLFSLESALIFFFKLSEVYKCNNLAFKMCIYIYVYFFHLSYQRKKVASQ